MSQLHLGTVENDRPIVIRSGRNEPAPPKYLVDFDMWGNKIWSKKPQERSSTAWDREREAAKELKAGCGTSCQMMGERKRETEDLITKDLQVAADSMPATETVMLPPPTQQAPASPEEAQLAMVEGLATGMAKASEAFEDMRTPHTYW